jgi:hypothetical protein
MGRGRHADNIPGITMIHVDVLRMLYAKRSVCACCRTDCSHRENLVYFAQANRFGKRIFCNLLILQIIWGVSAELSLCMH